MILSLVLVTILDILDKTLIRALRSRFGETKVMYLAYGLLPLAYIVLHTMDPQKTLEYDWTSWPAKTG